MAERTRYLLELDLWVNAWHTPKRDVAAIELAAIWQMSGCTMTMTLYLAGLHLPGAILPAQAVGWLPYSVEIFSLHELTKPIDLNQQLATNTVAITDRLLQGALQFRFRSAGIDGTVFIQHNHGKSIQIFFLPATQDESINCMRKIFR